jgi:hypothetical protein
MPTALIDGLEVYYETRGSGQPLLMLRNECEIFDFHRADGLTAMSLLQTSFPAGSKRPPVNCQIHHDYQNPKRKLQRAR